MVDQPVYLLAGSEQFLKEETLAKIKSALLDKESEKFNFNLFYGTSTPAEKVLECARTAPFFGRRRIVFVRQSEQFSAPDKEYILSYCKTPHKQTLLILETSEVTLKEKFFNRISKYARVIFCNPLTDNRLFGWLSSRLAKEGKGIEEKALQLLVNNLGNNLQVLSSSLESLVLYIGPRKNIGLEDVRKLAGEDINAGVFELFNAVIAGKKTKAFQVLDSLLKDGINAAQILGALTHQTISKRSRINRFQQCLLELEKADSDIKTGRQTQRFALELLLVRLLQLI
jgi:DNA polymerase-3 subunit delta